MNVNQLQLLHMAASYMESKELEIYEWDRWESIHRDLGLNRHATSRFVLSYTSTRLNLKGYEENRMGVWRHIKKPTQRSRKRVACR